MSVDEDLRALERRWLSGEHQALELLFRARRRIGACPACGRPEAAHDHADRWLCDESVKLGTVPGDDGPLCPRCRCCSMTREGCDSCSGDGVVLTAATRTVWDRDWDEGVEWGDDVCQVCDGAGRWWECRCGPDGKHAPLSQ